MAATVFDPFEILGIRPDASAEQIRAAYREQVARYHPDKHRGNPLEDLAAAKLVAINRAYEILSDDRQRAQFEMRSARSGRGASSGPTTPSTAPTPAMKLVRSIVMVVALLFFLRFGLAFGRQILALLRGFMLGVLWVFRLGPAFALAVIFAVALGASLFLRSRKG